MSGLTAQAQTVDWSLLKILRKSDSVSQPFENWLMSEIKKSLQKRDLTPELASVAKQCKAGAAHRIAENEEYFFRPWIRRRILPLLPHWQKRIRISAYLIVKNGGMELA